MTGTRLQYAAMLKPTKKVVCPLLIIVGSGDLPRQLGLGDVLEFAWGYTLAQRLRLAREYLQGQHVRVLPGANTLSAARIARWILPCPLS